MQDQYPECSRSPYDIAHLFNYDNVANLFNFPKRPTNLGVEYLWLHPRKTAEFLGLDKVPDDTESNDDM